VKKAAGIQGISLLIGQFSVGTSHTDFRRINLRIPLIDSSQTLPRLLFDF
jgi:hypothetical protein